VYGRTTTFVIERLSVSPLSPPPLQEVKCSPALSSVPSHPTKRVRHVLPVVHMHIAFLGGDRHPDSKNLCTLGPLVAFLPPPASLIIPLNPPPAPWQTKMPNFLIMPASRACSGPHTLFSKNEAHKICGWKRGLWHPVMGSYAHFLELGNTHPCLPSTFPFRRGLLSLDVKRPVPPL
jgi:hypothetical protein